jgi:hypothetical protein
MAFLLRGLVLALDRCANFRSELRDARRAEREAITTTQSDQASLRRQPARAEPEGRLLKRC